MKKLLLAIGAIVVLIIAVAIIVPFFVPLDSYKIQITDTVKQSTGRDLAINGKISFSIFPRLAVEVNEVSIGNAPGDVSKTMSTLSKLQVRLQLIPLLSGKIVVDSFVLDKPVIDLEIDKNGRPNWEVSQPKSPAEAQTSPTKPTGPTASAKFDFDDIQLGVIRMDDGLVRFTDQRTGQSYTVGGINVTVTMADLDHPLKINGKATYNSKDVTVDLMLAKPRRALAGDASDFTLALGGDLLTLSVNGSMSSGATGKVAGAVDLKIPSIRTLATWAGKPLPASAGPLGLLTISGKLTAAGAKLAFTDAKLAVDAIKGDGELSIDASTPKPSIKGRLALDRLDLNPYMAQTAATSPTAAPASPAAASAKQRGWSTDPVDVSGLNAANADLALSFTSLAFKKFEIGKGAMTVALHDAHLELDLTQLELYQGKGTGQVIVDGKGVPAIDTTFKLDGVQLGPLVKAAGIGDWISGTVSTNFQIAGTGHSEKELIDTLGGKGGLAVTSGTITGVDLGALLTNPVKAIEEQATKTGKTDFANLTGTYTIASGIVKNTDLAMSSPVFQLAGTGSVSLPPQTVDYRIEPKLSAGSKGPGLSVPIKVSGPWSDLSYQPDLAAVLADPSKAVGAVKGLLGKSKDPNAPTQKPAELLKGLLGH